MRLTIQSDDISIYKAYIKDAKSLKYLNNPFLFSDANNIDLDTISKYLPILTKIEEIIITYIHIYLQVVQVYRQQY